MTKKCPDRLFFARHQPPVPLTDADPGAAGCEGMLASRHMMKPLDHRAANNRPTVDQSHGQGRRPMAEGPAAPSALELFGYWAPVAALVIRRRHHGDSWGADTPTGQGWRCQCTLCRVRRPTGDGAAEPPGGTAA